VNKKQVIAALLIGVAIGTAATAGGSKDKGAYKIGFVQLIDNITFKTMRDGFNERMAELGYGPTVAPVTLKDAQGDTATLNTIAQEFAGGGYDVVISIATPPTQAFVNQGSATANVFIAVSDPVAAKLTTTLAKPDKNSTGTSDYIPMERLLDLADRLTPGIKTYGFIYTYGEPNAVGVVADAKKYLASKCKATTEITVQTSNEVQQAAEALVGKVDAIFIPNDSIVVSAITQVVAIATPKKVPVYGTALVHVDGGALATVGIDDRLIGRRSAEMVVEYLKGTPIASIPVVIFDDVQTYVNVKSAASLGVTLGDEFKSAVRIDK
jgi:putative ABC transport system substrate-binding protein